MKVNGTMSSCFNHLHFAMAMHRAWLALVATLVALTALSMVTGAQAAQQGPHRAVFDAAVDGKDLWQFILSNVENTQQALGVEDTQVVVVAYGKGLGMLLKTNADMQERLARMAKNGVTFAACRNTMRAMGIGEQDLLPFVTTVDSGVAELVRRQEAGWAYIKGGR